MCTATSLHSLQGWNISVIPSSFFGGRIAAIWPVARACVGQGGCARACVCALGSRASRSLSGFVAGSEIGSSFVRVSQFAARAYNCGQIISGAQTCFLARSFERIEALMAVKRCVIVRTGKGSMKIDAGGECHGTRSCFLYIDSMNVPTSDIKDQYKAKDVEKLEKKGTKVVVVPSTQTLDLQAAKDSCQK
jgi:hypothetical protein